MSTPQPDTLEREKDKLWLTDAELIRRMGVPECLLRQCKIGRAVDLGV